MLSNISDKGVIDHLYTITISQSVTGGLSSLENNYLAFTLLCLGCIFIYAGNIDKSPLHPKTEWHS